MLLLGNWSDLKLMIPRHNRLLGWGLVALGAWSLYSILIEPMLYDLLALLHVENAYYYISSIPTVLIAVLLIAAGVWLLGLHPQRRDSDNLPPLPPRRDAAVIQSV